MDVDDKKKLEEKILSILSDPKATYDPDHALILSQMHGFSRGTLFLYEKKGLHDQVRLIEICNKAATSRSWTLCRWNARLSPVLSSLLDQFIHEKKLCIKRSRLAARLRDAVKKPDAIFIRFRRFLDFECPVFGVLLYLKIVKF